MRALPLNQVGAAVTVIVVLGLFGLVDVIIPIEVDIAIALVNVDENV